MLNTYVRTLSISLPLPLPSPSLPLPPPSTSTSPFLHRLFLQIMLYLEAVSAGATEGLDSTSQVCLCVYVCVCVCVCVRVCMCACVHSKRRGTVHLVSCITAEFDTGRYHWNMKRSTKLLPTTVAVISHNLNDTLHREHTLLSLRGTSHYQCMNGV